MDLRERLRQAWIVFLLTMRYLLSTRRAIATASLSLIPVLVAGSLALARVATFDILLFQVVMVPLLLQVVLIFVTVVNANALLREEIEDQTLVYFLTRPVSKPAVATFKYLGALVAGLVVLVPPLIVAYGITQSYAGIPLGADLDVLGGFLAATVLGTAAYTAFFTFLSILLRRPLWAGLLFGFVWESIVGSIPGDVPRLSIIHYLRSVLKDVIAVGPLATYRTDLSASIAAVVLAAFVIAMLVTTALIFQNMDFRQKA